MTDNQPSPHSQSTPPAPAVDLVACAEVLVRTVLRGVAEEVDHYGLSAAEFSLLKSCMGRGECTATDLVGVLPVDASRISRLVTSLVKKDLLVRRRLTSDRRVVMLRLSDKGTELTSMLIQHIDARNARLVEDIGEEDLTVFESVTLELLANYEAMQSSPISERGDPSG